ncbi:MAG: hypothetical protein Q8941_11010 [Bacteroidota bacterium]|nr:hypothetical protein [Bacteroidota bacterium]
MTCTVVDFAKDAVVYTIAGTTKEELDNKLNLFFTSEGFSRKSDTGAEKIFQRGNKITRILFGVFVKYFQVAVSIKAEGQAFSLHLRRDMNFFLSGGLAGIGASRKEFTRISDAFKVYFNN